MCIWHGHDYKSNALGLVVRRLWPMKLVTTVHGWVFQTSRTPVYYGIDKLCLRFYDEVVCVSKDLYRECLRVGVRQARCRLIENAIDILEYRRAADQDTVTRQPVAATRRRNASAKRIVLGAMGRLSEEKGFDVLIDAVGRFLQQGAKVLLRIAGDGPDRQKLAQLIDKRNLADHVELLGYVSDQRMFFDSLDVFVLSSLREGLPNVLLEAMAFEVPVVATRVAGVPDLLEDGVNGILVEPGSADALAIGIGKLLADCDLRFQLAAAARDTVVHSYSFEERMRKMVQVYDRVIGRQRSFETMLETGAS